MENKTIENKDEKRIGRRKVLFEKVPKPNFELLQHLTEAPDDLLDKRICEDIAALITGPEEAIPMGLLKAKEMCQYGSLASPVMIMIIYKEWERLTGGIMPDPALCTWREPMRRGEL